MPFPNLSRTTQRRAMTQAGANTESGRATVTRTYADAQGNITAADVRVDGQVSALVQVANASGLKLYAGASVEIRAVRGNKHARQIVGAAGSSTTAATAASASAPPQAPAAPGPLLDQSPVLLQSADTADAPMGYVEAPGANVLFTDTPPGAGSGGAPVNGQRLIAARPLVAPALPNALTTTLPDGTLLDLVDSYGNPQGMYRLDVGAGVWRRRDVATPLRIQKDSFILAGSSGPFALSRTPNGLLTILFEDAGFAQDSDYTLSGTQLTLTAAVNAANVVGITFVYSF